MHDLNASASTRLTCCKPVMAFSNEHPSKVLLVTVDAPAGQVKEVIAVWPNAPRSMDVTASTPVTWVSEVHPLKHACGMVRTPAGQAKDIRLLVWKKASAPMKVTLSTPVTILNDVERRKAWKEMEEASLGQVNETRPLYAKAHAPIEFTASMPVIDVSPVHPWKACDGISVISGGIWNDPVREHWQALLLHCVATPTQLDGHETGDFASLAATRKRSTRSARTIHFQVFNINETPDK